MRSSVAFLLLLRVLPSVGQEVTTPDCQDVSPRAECLGIQGTGKNADICCASDCTCACGGDVPENAGKDCFLTEIRAEPPGICTGAELNAACTLVAEPITGAPCGTVNGVVVDGVLDEDSMLCCPEGCGTCGGIQCSTTPMSWVWPDPEGGPLAVDPDVPADATSGGYCCMSVMDTLTTVCGIDGAVAPCLMPQDLPVKTDTCGVDGIEGTADADGQMCCSLGCDICGSSGCGEQHLSEVAPGDLPWSTSAPEGATTADYCCTDAFTDDLASQDRFCGDEGVEPPCLIRSGATLPPLAAVEDTCNVDGMEGIANKNKCCPLGCGQCGGSGCGSIDMGYVTPTLQDAPSSDAKSSMYCCSGTSTFTEATPVCSLLEGNFPPCYIPDTTTTHPPVITPTSVGTTDGGSGDGSTTPSPSTVDDRSSGGDGSSTAAPGATLAPAGATPAPSMEVVNCMSVFVTIEDAEEFDGVYVMDMENEILFVKNDSSAVMMYVPYEADQVNVAVTNTSDTNASSSTMDSGMVDATANSTMVNSTMNSTMTTECGHWVLLTMDSDNTTSEFPMVHVQDCATNPENIDPMAMWMVQHKENETALIGVGVVECLNPIMAPSPGAPGAPVANDTGGNSDGSGTDDGATPSPSMEVANCTSVFVMIEDAEEFDGVYVMDMENELLFVKNDSSAVMMYVPYETDHVDVDVVVADTSTTMTDSSSSMKDSGMVDSTTNSTTMVNSTMNSTMNTECGHWVLLTMDSDNTTSEFPMVHVQDCATNPENIDPMAMWMVQHKENETALIGVGVVECLNPIMAPSPGAPGAPVAPVGATPSPANDGSPLVDRASSGSNSKGLSTGEAAGVGVTVSAVAVVGVVALGRWAKSR